MKNDSESSSQFKAWLLLILLALIWGSSFILMKKGLVTYSAGELAAIRISSAGLVMIPFCLYKLKGISGSQWLRLFITGFIGSFLPAFLFAAAQTKLSSSITGILNSLTPIFALFCGFIMFSQPVKKNQFWGIFLGFAGSLVLILIGGDSNLGGANIYGLLVVLATFCYGYNINFIKFRLPELNSLLITALSLVLVTPLSLIYLFGFTDFVNVTTNSTGAGLSLFYILVLGVIGTALALFLFNYLLKISSAVFTSSVTYLIPIVAIAWGVLDGESIYFHHFLGMAIIVLGVYLTKKST